MVSNSIKEYIDKNITSDNALELAYEIYILLGKVLYYSPLYAKYKLDNLIPELDRIRIDNPYINCITWSSLYDEILKLYDIDSNVVGAGHKAVEIRTDGYRIIGDQTLYLGNSVFDESSDLANIKFGLSITQFRLRNHESKEDFYKRLDKINKKYNIDKKIDNKIIENIELTKDKDKEYRIKYGINFYNEFYNKSDGEVERRQIFERYYNYLFSDIDKDIIEFYDAQTLSKHILFLDNKHFIETLDGFIYITPDEIIDLLDDQTITLRFEKDYDKKLIKTRIN